MPPLYQPPSTTMVANENNDNGDNGVTSIDLSGVPQSLEPVTVLTTEPSPQISPTRPTMLRFFDAVRYLTVLVATLLAIDEFLAFFYLQPMTFIENILSLYLILVGALIVANELNLFDMTSNSQILRLWTTRGLLYCLGGVLTLNQWQNTAILVQTQQSGSMYDDTSTGYLDRMVHRNFVKVIGWYLVGVGLAYMFMGLLCLQVFYDNLEGRYNNNQRTAHQWNQLQKEHQLEEEEQKQQQPKHENQNYGSV